MEINAQYNVARADSLPVRIAGAMRRKMYGRFIAEMAPAESDTILDVGVTGDRTYAHSNYLELWYPFKHRITALGIDDASFLETEYPGVRFFQGDGRNLPFADQSFDFVHSSAVLEHVGARADQTRFLAELARVSRRGIFVTTPNRWFPIEFHTVLPLIHWLPPRVFRGILHRMNLDFFAEEANLNLLGRSDLRSIAAKAAVFAPAVDSVRLLGWPSNLLLTSRRGGMASSAG